jgi:hypothetical protein
LAKEYKTLVQPRATPFGDVYYLDIYYYGKKSISASWDKTLKMWNLQPGQH